MPRAKKTTTTKKATKKSTTTRKKTRTVRKKKVFKRTEFPFKLVNGEELTHFIDLAEKLADIESYVLQHHIVDDRHDFAQWIHDVFEDKELAKALENKKDPQEMRLIIYRHIVHKYLE